MMSLESAEGRPSLRSLCLAHRIDLLRLARASNVHPLLVWDVFVGNATSRETVHMLLCGFNELAGTQYTLGDIQVVLLEDRKAY